MMYYCSYFSSALVLLYALCMLNPIQVDAKNVVNIESFHDTEGRLHRRFNPDDAKLESRDAKRLPLDIDRIINEDKKLLKRDAKRLPLDIERIISEDKLVKRDPKRLPLDIEQIIAQDSKLVKRGKGSSQKNFESNNADYEVKPVSLDSKLPLLKETLIFSGYARNDLELSNKLSDCNEDLIIIAPTNDAISKLAMKPWEFPQDIESLESSGASAMEIDTAIQENILKFVRSHVVAYDEKRSYKDIESGYTILKSVDFEDSMKHASKGDILLKKEDDSFYVGSARDKKFHLVQKIERASNGVILVVDSCLEWP